MILLLALRRLLAILAVVSLALAPATASAVPEGDAARMAAMADPAADGMAAMDDMPCCPPAEPMLPDCQKACPLAALCLAKVASGLPAAAAVLVRMAIPSRAVWGLQVTFVSETLRPPPEPPQS